MWSPSRAAKERIAKRRSSLFAGMNLWPFVGVLIGILVLLMVYTPPCHHCSSVVDMPLSVYAAAEPKANREDAIRIFVTRDGSVFFRYSKVNSEDLYMLIRQALREGAEKKVYLAVDARSRYGDIEPILDEIRAAGIREICFLAEKPMAR